MAWESSRRWGKSLSPSTCMGDLEEVPDSWLWIGTAPPLQPFVLFLVLSQMPSTTPPVPKWQSLLEPKTHASGPEVDSLPSSISDAVWNNTLLGSLVVFASLLVLCNTQCYVELYDKNPEDPPDECRDLDGVTHKLNVEWKTENCYTCSCDETGIHCCNTAAIPGGFDTTKCKTIFHKDTCSYSVVELENPDKECPVSSWIL